MLLIMFFSSFFVFEVSAWLLVNDNHISIFKLFGGSLLRNYVFPELHYLKKRGGGVVEDCVQMRKETKGLWNSSLMQRGTGSLLQENKNVSNF